MGRSRTTMILAISIASVISTAHATGSPPKPSDPSATSQSISAAAANAEATAIGVGIAHASGGRADANAIGLGGEGGEGGKAHANAEGGAGGDAQANQTQSAQGGDASNAGLTQAVNFVQRRNAPSVGQGSLMPSGCGAAGNAGGSQEGGAAFLGIAWTTDQCYALLAAASYAAIGMPDTSCDLLNSMKSVQRAYKRIGKSLPDCTTAENRDPTPAVVVLDSHDPAQKDTSPTRDEVNEAINRAFKASQAK